MRQPSVAAAYAGDVRENVPASLLVHLRRARDHVDRHYRDPLDLDELAGGGREGVGRARVLVPAPAPGRWRGHHFACAAHNHVARATPHRLRRPRPAPPRAGPSPPRTPGGQAAGSSSPAAHRRA